MSCVILRLENRLMNMAENPNEGIQQDSPQENTALVRSTNFRELLPKGFSLQITARQAAAEQKGLLQDRTITFSQVTNRLTAIEGSVRPTRTADDAKTLVRLLTSSDQVLALYKTDPLEQYRIDQGLVGQREHLYNQLYRELSAEKGLDSFNRATGKNYADIQALNQDYPHVLQAELALFSLVDSVPAVYVEAGKPRPNNQALIVEDDDFLVPMMVGASVNGLLCTRYADDPNVIAPDDAYGQVGITGAPGPIEVVPFKASVEAAVTELVSLTISNYRMHERVINNSPTATVDGFSKLDRVVLEKILGSQYRADVPLGRQLSSLTPEQRREFEQAKTEMDRLIAQAIVIDPNTGHIMNTGDIVKLIGVLDSIPQVLVNEQKPFQGFFIPYGPGVMFLNEEGQPMQYIPYRGFYLRNALQGLYYETVDIGKNNNTMALIFNDLSRQAEAASLLSFEENNEDLSQLEEIKMDIKLVYGIDLDIHPRMDIVATSGEAEARNLRGAVTKLEPRLKIGLDEAKQIFETLKLLPKELLGGVKIIRKHSRKLLTLEDIMEGAEMVASFEKGRGILTIYEDPNLPYIAFSPELRVQKSFAIVHEVAHSLWGSVPPELRRQWQDISWDNEGKRKDEVAGFLTLYSHVATPEEDFCDSFASYVLHGNEFRTKAQDNTSLSNKYDFIKQFLANRLGRGLEFSQISPYNLEAISGAIDQQIEKLSKEQSAEMIGNVEAREDVVARQAMESVTKSTDRAQAVDVVDPSDDSEAIENAADPIGEQIYRESMQDFQRESVNTILDYIGGEQDEERALRIAQRVYDLMNDDELEKAQKLARRYIRDKDKFEVFVQELEQMHTDLVEGNIGTRRQKLL